MLAQALKSERENSTLDGSQLSATASTPHGTPDCSTPSPGMAASLSVCVCVHVYMREKDSSGRVLLLLHCLQVMNLNVTHNYS